MLLLCGAIFGILEWRRRTRDLSDLALLSRLPDNEGVTAYLNVAILRENGLLDMLAGSRTDEEPEYRAFVQQTGFDYRESLDAVMANIRPEASLFIVRGRFSWDQISTYIKANQGKCFNGVCWMEVRRGRFLSILPISTGVVAIGTGQNRGVVYDVQEPRAGHSWQPPADPFWVRLPADQFNDPKRLPEGTRSFASAVRGARSVVIGVAPGGAQGLEAHLRAEFASPVEASSRRAELEQATGLLQKFFARDGQTPSTADLSGMLTAGRFEQAETTVRGAWPLHRALLERVVSGL